ncbi:MAG TPA: hypothetical protein VFV71_13350 [Burkholderiales bacterium]|nr:hypothetical protein [Burkholderiales bacterium]
MKRYAIALLAVLAVPGQAMAQDKQGAVVVDTTEAIVTVVDVDREARTVVVRGPNGRDALVNVPPESQNLDQVHPGAKFRVRYLQSVALSIAKGGAAIASTGRTVNLAPKGDTPGGTIIRTAQISGVLESIDRSSRLLSVRGPDGRLLAFTADDSVQGLDQLEQGNVISVEFTEAIAMRMILEK